ncbi:MAG TPA: MFS transporter, partial [Pseudolysinimonas sp.]|nr:MFS transporter [Pseudolysinimonas sp.]
MSSRTTSSWGDIRHGVAVLIAGFIGSMAGFLAVVSVPIGIMTSPLESTFGWTRAEIGSLALIAGVTLGFSGLFSGWLTDKFGPRLVVGIATPLLTITILLMYFEASGGADLNKMRLLYILAGFFGSGTTPVVYGRAIAGRFSSGRGLALGLITLGGAVATIGAPLLIGGVIVPKFGIATVYLSLAIISILPLPFALAFFQRKRELPASATSAIPTLTGAARLSVFRTRVFWQISIPFLLLALCTAIINSQSAPALVDRGLELVAAAALISGFGIGSVAGRLLSGL